MSCRHRADIHCSPDTNDSGLAELAKPRTYGRNVEPPAHWGPSAVLRRPGPSCHQTDRPSVSSFCSQLRDAVSAVPPTPTSSVFASTTSPEATMPPALMSSGLTTPEKRSVLRVPLNDMLRSPATTRLPLDSTLTT